MQIFLKAVTVKKTGMSSGKVSVGFWDEQRTVDAGIIAQYKSWGEAFRHTGCDLLCWNGFVHWFRVGSI